MSDSPDDYFTPAFLGVKRTVEKYADGFVDFIHDYVDESEYDE